MRAIAIVLLCLLTGSACQEKYSFTTLAETSIQPDALANHSKVTIIYASGGPDLNEAVNYLYRYIAVGPDSTDTTNILSPVRTTIKAGDDQRLFIAARSEAEHDLPLLMEAFQGKEPLNVVSNKPYQSIEENAYPTVIGLLTHPDAKAPIKQ